MAEVFLSECLDRSSRAALAKIRARGEHLRLVYEAELAEHLRFLADMQEIIAHAWRGKSVRLEFLSRRKALMDVQRAWKRAVVRRGLQREIGARVAVSRFHGAAMMTERVHTGVLQGGQYGKALHTAKALSC